MILFYAHVVPEHPHRGDRGTVFSVWAAHRRDAIRKAKAEHDADPEYTPGRDGRLIWSAVPA